MAGNRHSGGKTVTVTRRGGVATVRFERRAQRNALDTASMRALSETARAFHVDPAVGAVILTGTEDAFSAGIDLKENKHWNDDSLPAARRLAAGLGREMCRNWEQVPAPTVAAIEGYAIGGGVVLAASCDWRVMAENAFLLVPEIEIGLNLGWGALPRLVNLMGASRAKRFAILCERMNAARALEWGLVDEVVSTGKTLAAARKIAARVAEMPPVAARMTKESINAYAGALAPLAVHMDVDQAEAVRSSAAVTASRRRFATRGKGSGKGRSKSRAKR